MWGSILPYSRVRELRGLKSSLGCGGDSRDLTSSGGVGLGKWKLVSTGGEVLTSSRELKGWILSLGGGKGV